MLLPQYSYQYPSLSEGADRVGGQLHGDKRVPLQWCNHFRQSLEEGAGKRYSECEGSELEVNTSLRIADFSLVGSPCELWE